MAPRPRSLKVSVWSRRGVWQGAYYDETGKRRTATTGVPDNGTDAARAKASKVVQLLQDSADRVRAGGLPTIAPGKVTLREYAKSWNAERAAAGIVDARNELTRLRLHAFPVVVDGRALGDYALTDVTRAHVKALARHLGGKAELAPRSKYHVFNTLHSLFSEALDEERVDANPCSLNREKYLGPKVDADPEWRRGAVFTVEELTSLLYDERVNPARRVFYGLLFLTGARFGEVVALRWRHIDSARKPLGELLVAHSHGRSRTKTAVVRRVPIHPALAALLAAWKLGGWAQLLGKEKGPEPDDLVVPTEQGTMRRQQNAWDYLQRDLDRLGYRPRRQHDARRTLITLARAAGANVHLLRVMTHGLRQREIVDVYTDEAGLWDSLCAELAKLQVRGPRRGLTLVTGEK